MRYTSSISIHALREEGDGELAKATVNLDLISIHALREEGDVRAGYGITGAFISIHALREEGDRGSWRPCSGKGYFYPRPPRGGRRSQVCRHSHRIKFLSTPSARRATQVRTAILDGMIQFLSTPSARRATRDTFAAFFEGRYFYPRPPRGGRPVSFVSRYPAIGISIHALREEGDSRGRTTMGKLLISIHALREEGDPPAKR